MVTFIFWLMFSALVGVFASKRGRSGFGWFLIALILSPLIAAILLALIPPNIAHIESRELRTGTSRKCPFCAELVRAEARVCKHCGRDLESGISSPV